MPAPPPEPSTPQRLILERIATPIGEALVATDEAGVLRAFDFSDFESRMRTLLRRHYAAMEPQPGTIPPALRAAIDAYFAGHTDALSSVAWATNGTLFQRKVWAGLCTIPRGQTLSYKGLAARIGSPAAIRAVGLANGANPVAIVAPCHRVIGADGSLTGYGGGLSRKAWLLAHEGAIPKVA